MPKVVFRLSSEAMARADARARIRTRMPDAQVRVLADGGAEVCVRVDEPLGLMPWLLGWGAACRVQAPAVLRERMAQEVRTLALRYGWFISQVPGAPAVVEEEDVENG